jgi:hypothetical protein
MSRYLALAQISLALAVWTLTLLGLGAGWEPLVSWLYLFAWWPYLLLGDGLLLLLTGGSWLKNRPWEFLRLAFWSVTAWLVFEAFNLILLNWRYVGMQPQVWLRWPGYALAFATVLPGIMITAQVLAVLGAWRGARGRPLALGHWQPGAILVGSACLVLPLLLPHYAFPLIWLGFIFLLDPINDRLRGASLIRRWARGDRQEVLCLITAGLICGVWWELWNYPARAKWIYTLPAFNFWNIFEMPLLGYLGFLPFALECAVIYNFFRALEARYLTTPRRRLISLLLHLTFWAVMFAAIDQWTVASLR